MTKWLPCMVILIGILASAAFAQAPEETQRLIVGTREVPPFAIQAEDGSWSGISIELWEQIAGELGYTSEYRDMPLEDLLTALEDKSVDAVVGALTTTADREAVFDFSQPFYNSGLGIAVSAQGGSLVTGLLRSLLSPDFLKAFSALAAVLLLVGIAIWLLERKRNREQFGGSALRGLGAGFWWAGVTMTTVGYGDKAPLTAGGRVLGLIWMFASVISISAFTAAIASSLALGQMGARIQGPDDLPGNVVGTVEGSTSEAYLRQRRIRTLGRESLEEAMQNLADGQTDAVVYDAPLLSYLANQEFSGQVIVLPYRFDRQSYAIGLPDKSPLREQVNRLLLEQTHAESWADKLFDYLGEE